MIDAEFIAEELGLPEGRLPADERFLLVSVRYEELGQVRTHDEIISCIDDSGVYPVSLPFFS